MPSSSSSAPLATKTRQKIVIWGIIIGFAVLFLFGGYRIIEARRDMVLFHLDTLSDMRLKGEMNHLFDYGRRMDTKIFGALWPLLADNAPQLEAVHYYLAAHYYHDLNRRDDALFWLMLGRMRLDYDIQRCVAEPDALTAWFHYFDNRMTPSDLVQSIHDSPEAERKAIEGALSWLAENGVDMMPRAVCSFMKAPSRQPPSYKPQHQWLAIKKDLEERYFERVRALRTQIQQNNTDTPTGADVTNP